MKVLFEVSFKVDAKRLGEALVSLDGKVYDLHHRIIKLEEGESDIKLIPHFKKPKGGGKVIEKLRTYVLELKGKGVDSFTTKQAVEFLGIHPNYTSSLLTKLQKDKVLKRVRAGVFKISG